MKLSRRFAILSLVTLVVFSTGVFLFGETAYAESLQPIGSLSQNQPVLEQVNTIVSIKKDTLNTEQDKIQQLVEKKQNLAKKLEDVKNDIKKLNDQIAEKKAAAEAEQKRIKELQNMFVHVTRYANGSAGNMYDAGNCTWYVKSRRPDLPNNLGNANTWYSMAAADGFSVGSKPKKGAVGTSTRGSFGHVVYVEGISLDGQTITISEMNYAGLYSQRTRVTSASEFSYIYELH